MKHVGKIITWLGIGVYAVCAALIIVTLMPVGGWKALDVLTGSMRPTIQPGDLVIIHKVPLTSIKSGNIVTYTNPNNPAETITHRVVSKQLKNGLLMVTTKGDANPAADPPFAGGHIVGRVSTNVPFAGKVINTLHDKFALIALVVIPGLVVIWAEIERLRKALAKAKYLNVESTTKNNQPPPPPPPPEPPLRKQRRKQTVKRPTRGLDGMGRHTLGVLFMMALASLCVGITHAAKTTNAVTATSKVVVVHTTPPPNQPPCPPGFVIISQSAAGSLTTYKCRSTQFTNNITVNITVITNSNNQSSTSGNVTGGGSSGNSSNSNTTSNTVTNNNPTPSPSPSPSLSPSPSPHPSS